MQKLGKRQLTLQLQEPLAAIPPGAVAAGRSRSRAGGMELEYTFDAQGPSPPTSPRCCAGMADLGIGFKDLNTRQSSLEEIFVSLVSDRGEVRA